MKDKEAFAFFADDVNVLIKAQMLVKAETKILNLRDVYECVITKLV